MALSFVQKALVNGGSSPTSLTFAVTLPGNVTAGNLLAVAVFWGQGAEADFTSIADTLGNTYVLVDHAIANTDPVRTYYAKNILGGACTITVTLNTARAFESLLVHEVAGASTSAPLDQHALASQTTPGTGVDAVTSGAVTTAQNGEYCYGASFVHNTVADTLAAGTGYTLENQALGDGTHGPVADEFQVQGTAGSVAATFTQNANQNVSTALMTFAAVAVGASRPLFRGV